jgi:hypothetical protein
LEGYMHQQNCCGGGWDRSTSKREFEEDWP